MFTGWWELLHAKINHKREFVSLDAKRNSAADQRQFELTRVGSRGPLTLNTLSIITGPTIISPTETAVTSASFGAKSPEYYGKDISLSREVSVAREYHNPHMSFSSPRTPSQSSRTGSRNGSQRGVREWDPTSTYARGGLGLHPPNEEEADFTRNRI